MRWMMMGALTRAAPASIVTGFRKKDSIAENLRT
jgi:hypothetical protein